MTISICRDGVEIGEWLEHEVRAFYAERRLVATDLYWREGMSEWKSLSSFIHPPPPFPENTKTASPPPLPVVGQGIVPIPPLSESSLPPALPANSRGGTIAAHAEDAGIRGPWQIKTKPFLIGGFLIPFFFLLHFRKRTFAWIYFIVARALDASKSDALEWVAMALQLCVMIYVGVKGNEIIESSGLIKSQDAYDRSFTKWTVAGVVIWVIIIGCLYFANMPQR